MQAVVPAAGAGTRLRPYTTDQPKGLVDVAGKPLLSHGFGTLERLGVTEAVVVVGYRGDEIRSHYGGSFEGISLSYVEQPERLGLAHAVSQAEPLVEEPFILLNGDNVFDADLRPLVECHRAGDAAVTTVVEKPDDPPSRTIPRGVSVCSQLLFSACELVTPSHTGEYELSAASDLSLDAGHEIETVPFEGWCCNVNTDRDRKRVAAHFG